MQWDNKERKVTWDTEERCNLGLNRDVGITKMWGYNKSNRRNSEGEKIKSKTRDNRGIAWENQNREITDGCNRGRTWERKIRGTCNRILNKGTNMGTIQRGLGITNKKQGRKDSEGLQ